MIRLLCFVLAVLAASIQSKMRLEAENAVLRHQLTVLRRRLQGRVRLTNNDRRYLISIIRALLQRVRNQRSLDKDAPVSRSVQRTGSITSHRSRSWAGSITITSPGR